VDVDIEVEFNIQNMLTKVGKLFINACHRKK